MRILHIASFDGNIGDCANHSGFWRSFRRYICPDSEISSIEAREFFNLWGLKRFDSTFVEVANTHDLVVFGGGSFFEPSISNSCTGTTIDISADLIQKIRVPVLFNGVGVGRWGATETAEKFRTFLEIITSLPNFFISVRNDGSWDMIASEFGSELAKKIIKVPDGAFFIQPEPSNHIELQPQSRHIAVVLSGDNEERRFPRVPGGISRFECVQGMAAVLERLIDERERMRVVFVPHIPADLKMIAEALSVISDIKARTSIAVSPLVNGTRTNGLNVFDLYKHCDLVIGMRHHAIISGVALNVPTIGVVSHPRHADDFHEMGIPHRRIFANRKGFEARLYELSADALAFPEKYRTENLAVLNRVEALNDRYFHLMRAWFDGCACGVQW